MTLHNGQYHLRCGDHSTGASMANGAKARPKPASWRHSTPDDTRPSSPGSRKPTPDQIGKHDFGPQDPTPRRRGATMPRPAHQQDGQGRVPDAKAQPAEGRNRIRVRITNLHQAGRAGPSPPGRQRVPGRQLRPHPPEARTGIFETSAWCNGWRGGKIQARAHAPC